MTLTKCSRGNVIVTAFVPDCIIMKVNHYEDCGGSNVDSRRRTIVSLCSLLVNLLPFLTYSLLVLQQHGTVTNFWPFAIFYAFRHSALLLFRDWAGQYRELGKIGLVSGLLGAFCGLFGSLSPVGWDLSAVGLGLASSLFPTAVNQGKRVKANRGSARRQHSPSEQLMQLVLIGALLLTVVLFQRPIIDFTILFAASLAALIGGQYWRLPVHVPKHIYWGNYLLAGVLFAALFVIRVGRSVGIGQPIAWGVALLALFLALLIILLLANWHRPLAAPVYYQQAMFYGVCGQYWSMYSTIFVGAVAGVKLYYLVIVAYLAAILFGRPFAKIVYRYLPGNRLTINLALTTLGIGLTFWLPSYFLGIFLIRTFASQVRQQTISEYETATGNCQTSYIANYYYLTVGGLTAQLVMWTALLAFLKSNGVGSVLAAYAGHRLSVGALPAINSTHLLLAGYMLVYTAWLAVSRWCQRKH